jgi:hypothetical protein
MLLFYRVSAASVELCANPTSPYLLVLARLRLRSLIAVAGVTGAFAACNDDPAPRTVFVHVPAACAPDTVEAFGVFYAFGDFEATVEAPAEERTRLRDKGELERLPIGTRLLVADVSTLTDARTYRGIAAADTGADAHILLWPELLEGRPACALSGDLGARVDGGLGRVGRQSLLFTGGRSADGSNVPRSYVADLARGRIRQLPIGLASRRLNPTVTRFSPAAGPTFLYGFVEPSEGFGLVAGGADPESNLPQGTAEIYSEASGDFLAERIQLGVARADHAAVVLVNGETLLIGGRDANGALRSLEAVSPVTRRVRSSVGTLERARRNPIAMRLLSGRVLVLGGVDDAGAPVPDLELFEPDGARSAGQRAIRFPPARHQAAVPLLGGGALVVQASEDPSRNNVWRISADGIPDAAGVIETAPDEAPFLFPANDDRNALYAKGAWYIHNPWAAANADVFLPLSGPPRGGPAAGSHTADLGDPGLVAWTDDQAKLRALRFSTQSPYHRTRGELLTVDTRGFVPDRLPQVDGFRFDEAKGLALREGETTALAGQTFASFTLQFSGAPLVVLRDEFGNEFSVGLAGGDTQGAASCLFAFGDRSRIARSGQALAVESGPGRAACTLPFAPSARLSIAFRGTGLPRSEVRAVTARRE